MPREHFFFQIFKARNRILIEIFHTRENLNNFNEKMKKKNYLKY